MYGSAFGRRDVWRYGLYYWALDGMMAAASDPDGAAFRWSPPTALLGVQPPTLRTNDISYDVTPDGSRFLLVEPADESESQPLMLVTDWLASARRR